MNYQTVHHSLSPAHDVEQEVRHRYERLKLSLPFEAFRARTAAVARAINAKNTPNFLEQLHPRSPKEYADLQQFDFDPKRSKHARRTAELQIELEHALLLCMIAKLPTPKPLQNVLDEARKCCVRHDALLDQHAREDDTAEQRCRRGGHARHRDHQRLLRLSRRFLRTKAPVGMWRNKAHAAKTIAPYLRELGVRRRFSVSHSEETWRRNVAAFIRKDTQAAQVFQQHRGA